MRAPAMRRWENATALTATVLAAAALLPLPPSPRLLCAGVAIVMLLVLLGLRLRAHVAGAASPALRVPGRGWNGCGRLAAGVAAERAREARQRAEP